MATSLYGARKPAKLLAVGLTGERIAIDVGLIGRQLVSHRAHREIELVEHPLIRPIEQPAACLVDNGPGVPFVGVADMLANKTMQLCEPLPPGMWIRSRWR